jgi:hypothetical protein
MKIALSLALIAGSLFGVVQAPYPIAPGAATGLDSANAAVDKYPASEVESPEDTLAYWTKERMAQAVANSGAATADGRSAAGSAGASGDRLREQQSPPSAWCSTGTPTATIKSVPEP